LKQFGQGVRYKFQLIKIKAIATTSRIEFDSAPFLGTNSIEIPNITANATTESQLLIQRRCK
jgi:hypothetical protein